MRFRKDFIGLDGFFWWIGVVENRKDPLGLGRCQVRIFGVHSGSLSNIPSEDLPWAQPIHAVNNQSFSTPKEGDFVFGFFLDGRMAQSPVILGTVPGIPQEKTNAERGFADLRTDDALIDSPRKPAELQFKNDGSGVTVTEAEKAERYPTDSQLNHPTNSNLARNENVKDTLIQDRRENLVEVPLADGATWTEPPPAYSTIYPFNKVLETESGHIMEFDDTPSSERVHMAHRTGSYMEFYPSGSRSEKIVKNKYEVILSDDHVYIAGQAKITIGGNSSIKIVGDVELLAENNLNIKVAGDVNYTVGGKFNIKAEEINMESATDFNVQSDRNYNVDATLLNLNKGASKNTGLGDAPEIGTPNSPVSFVEPTPADRAAVFFDAGEEGVDDHIKEQLNKGVYTQKQLDQGEKLQPKEIDNTAPKVPQTTDENCEGIEKLKSFPDSLQLTPNITLGRVSSRATFGYRIRAQRGLSEGEIVCNLKLLAKNCLEPILQKYPNALITSAFRYPSGASAGRSQHEIGQAADIQFPGFKKSDYYDIVLWIRDNVPHDQLLLEYQTTGSGNPWVHISFNKDGNRIGGTKHATFVNHRKKFSGFVQLA
jgi:hypothetical protein